MADTPKQRANLGFGSALDDLDAETWAKPAPPPASVPEPQLRAVAEASGFESREPKRPAPTKAKPAPRARRIRRTGRSLQLNIKIREEDRDRFYRLCDGENWVLGYGFQRAVEALERELSQKSESEK